MDNKSIKKDYLEIVTDYKSLINVNKHKIPKYFENLDHDIDDINNTLNDYEKSGLLYIKYYDLLNSIGKFINKYEIDISTIKKSTINKINHYHRLHALNKACFSEPEDEINSDYDKDDEINSDYDEDNISKDDQAINKSNKDNREKIIIEDEDHINDLRIILREAMKNNDRDLMICTINLLRELESNKKNKINTANNQENNTNTINNQENKINTINNQENKINTINNQENITNLVTTYFKTPNWIEPLKCTISPENNTITSFYLPLVIISTST